MKWIINVACLLNHKDIVFRITFICNNREFYPGISLFFGSFCILFTRIFCRFTLLDVSFEIEVIICMIQGFFIYSNNLMYTIHLDLLKIYSFSKEVLIYSKLTLVNYIRLNLPRKLTMSALFSMLITMNRYTWRTHW